MFDSLLKSKFYSKCKSDVKMTKARIEMIKRKRKAMVKFLRNDIADLLKNNLDYNAYGRVEGLYVEQNMSSCYDLVEQACVLISSHISTMNKQKECPEECREAIASLMFAAARFADLPELRELRRLFSDRYGDSLEPFVSIEFVKKLKADPPTKEMKLQMMQEIALEYGFEWDSKALEQKLYRPPPSEQDWSPNANKDRNNERRKSNLQSGWVNKVQETESKHSNNHIEVEKKKEDGHPQGHSLSYQSGGTSHTGESTNRENGTLQEETASLEISGGRRLFGFRSMAPPYMKTDFGKKGTGTDTSPSSSSMEEKATGTKCTASNNHHSPEEPANKSKPVPRSVRRRPLKPPPGYNENIEASSMSPIVSNSDTHDHGQRDEEERMMDNLLMHYSRKPSKSRREPSKVESLSMRNRSWRSGAGVPRASSLPPESLTNPAATGSSKGHHRTGSYQQDSSSSPPLGHVHPKLPEYDDFVARLAALRANSK